MSAAEVVRSENASRSFGDVRAVDGLSLTLAAGEVMGFPLNYVLSIHRSKQTPAKIELPFIVLALLVSFFVRPGSPKFLLILVYIFYNFGLAGVSSVTSNILPDVTDVDEMMELFAIDDGDVAIERQCARACDGG